MELKRAYKGNRPYVSIPFNQTKMELKHQSSNIGRSRMIPFNQTKMELKRGTQEQV